jgi:hypothetical protein
MGVRVSLANHFFGVVEISDYHSISKWPDENCFHAPATALWCEIVLFWMVDIPSTVHVCIRYRTAFVGFFFGDYAVYSGDSRSLTAGITTVYPDTLYGQVECSPEPNTAG